MKKIRIATAHCKQGDIIAEDVLSSSGLKLIGINTIITHYIKQRLIELDISHIMIYEMSSIIEDPYLSIKQNYFENVATIKEILEQLSTGEGIKYDKVLELSDKLYDGISLSSRLVNCLNELRDVDEYTYTHSINTAFYSMLIAKWLGMNETQIKTVIQCGLLHDVGKLMVPADLLNKTDNLTNSEFKIMKKHTIFGYELLNNFDSIDKVIKKVALLHHERIDGSGYPFKLKSDYVDINTRIIAVADVFDAMTSDRMYKKRVTPFEAFKMFKTVGIGLFDTIIMNKFLDNIASFYTGMKVRLNTGETAQIVYVPPHDIANPVICLNNEYIDLSDRSNTRIIALV